MKEVEPEKQAINITDLIIKAAEMEASDESTKDAIANPNHGIKGHKISILDLILRIFAAAGTFASAVTMGTTDQSLPSSLQFVQFRARFNDLPTFTFFVISNSIVCAYLVLSLPISVFHIIRRSTAKITRIILAILDTVILVVLTSGASAAVSIVYLAHEGNASANWLTICPRFSNFCQRISASLIGSFFSIIILMLIIFTSLFYPL